MIPFIVGIAAVLLIVLTVYAIRKGTEEFERERNELFAQYAEKHGFQYSQVDTFRLRKKISTLAGFGIAEIPLKNIIHIPSQHGDIYLFDQMKITGRNATSQRGVFTVCLIESHKNYGADVIINEAVNAVNASMTRDMGSIVPGTGFIELEDKEFDDRFLVNGQQADSIKAMLNEEVKQFLFDSANRLSMQLSLQIKGNMLAVHNSASSKRNIDKEKDLEVLLDFAKGFPVAE